jgi:NADPH:quinone reductase-like Zn-dependent oxidoreductase
MQFDRFGPPEVLKMVELPLPKPGPGELLIRVGAVSVNSALDVQLRAGTSGYTVTLPCVPGVDPSGTVEAVGEGVTRFKPGDRVAAGLGPPPRGGGYAEYACVREQGATAVPDGLDFATATVVKRHFPTAYGLCRVSDLKAGETVLIMGASGGLASCAVQVAKALGATVIAGAGSQQRVQAALDLGAAHGVNYGQHDLLAEVQRITDGKGVNVVFDNIGDTKRWLGAYGSLGVGGRLVTVGTHGGDTVPLNVQQLYRKRLKVMSGLGGERPEDSDEALRLAKAGTYRVLIDRVLPLSQAAEGHRLVESNTLLGKVVLDPARV